MLLAMQQDMLLFGKMTMPNMFSSESPAFHNDTVSYTHLTLPTTPYV